MRHGSRLIALAVGVLVQVCVSMPVSAQTSPSVKRSISGDGTIQGQVQDDGGAPVAGATVTATGASTVIGITDRLGHFTLRSLKPAP